MTLNGAIMQLVELNENPMMPDIFKPAIQKVIETISECEEPKRGKWIEVVVTKGCCCHSGMNICDSYAFQCSECKELADNATDFCPNCGADMRGEEDEKD